MSNFYVTTPIYYVNDTPHIGHSYTTIIADVLARYHKMFGDEVFFLTGTDEHGQKVQKAAEARGLDPQAHCDEMVEHFKKVWVELQIEPSIFMRTTADFHKKTVQQALQYLFDKGEIYVDDYVGWYSESEEIFYTEKDLVDGKSPAGKTVTKITEKNYFFKMSKYQDRLIEYIESHPTFILPPGKKNEVLGFLRKPLSDLCISRPKSRLTWGIEIPFDHDYVTYVWFDALLNYCSALGYTPGAKAGDPTQAKFEKFWKEAVHLVGKDILTTHAVYWPTMLMALELPIPKTLFAHGWWLNTSGAKMSKSEGPVVKPLDVKDIVGVDSFRYFLCREIPFGNDAEFSQEIVVQRVNAELANNIGNLLSRSCNLISKFFEGKVPPVTLTMPESIEHAKLAAPLVEKVTSLINTFSIQQALDAVVEFLTLTNRYIDTMAPWKRIKTNESETAECLLVSLESVRISGILFLPVMPTKMTELLNRLSVADADRTFSNAKVFLGLKTGATIINGEPLFPRIELTPKK